MAPRQFVSLMGVAILVMIANVVCSVLYMVVYGYLIDAGHDQEYYNAHIQMAAPYCSIVAGIPLMYFAGWWVSGWWNRTLGFRGAWVVWGTYAVIDLAVLLVAGISAGIVFLFAVSMGTKLASALLGAKRRLAQTVA